MVSRILLSDGAYRSIVVPGTIQTEFIDCLLGVMVPMRIAD